MGTASLVVVRNPFHPAMHREQYAVTPGQTLAELAPKAGVFVIFRNGQSVLRKDWQQGVERDDLVAIVFLPRGGGGGGSNPLKIVLSIAMTIVAPHIAAHFFGEMVMAGAMSSVAFNAAVAGIPLVAESIINFQGGV